MKSMRLFVLAVTIFALAACGKTTAEKETDEANSRINKINAQMTYLNGTYLLNLNPVGGAPVLPSILLFRMFSNDSVQDIQNRLNDVIGNCNRVIELSGHDSFHMPNGDVDLVVVRTNGQIYLDAITTEITQRKAKTAATSP